MKRVLAVLVAVGMVVLSLYIRDRLDSAAGSDNGDGIGDDAGRPLVVCATELREACQALEDVDVRVEQAGDTAAALVGGPDDAELAAWVVPAPWPQLVNEARSRSARREVFAVVGDPVARSPLVLAVWEDRLAVLQQACEGEVGWACLGDIAPGGWEAAGGDAAWGRVKLAHRAPDVSGIGLLVAGQAATDYLGGTDYSLNDLRRADFAAWFAALEHAVVTRDPPLQTMLQFGPARVDVGGTVEADAVRLLANLGEGRQRPEIIYAEPAVTADIVIAGTAGREGLVGDLAEPLAEALAAQGWRVSTGGDTAAPLPPGAPPGAPATLPDGNGLPRAGVLDALRQVWQEVT